MYIENPTFSQPEDEKIKVWRYMDFTKFIALIDSKSLYFARTDKLDDPFEGSLPRHNAIIREYNPDKISSETRDQLIRAMVEMSKNNESRKKYMAVNCWHMNDCESAAMWKLYLNNNEGIAVQSTYSRLKKSLTDKEKIYLGRVKYIDYDSEYIDTNNIFEPFMHKRKSFIHENEVRALISRWPVDNNKIDFVQETIDHGVSVDVDVETLIERIFIAPNAPDWLSNLIKSVIHRYNYQFEIVHSKLGDNPIF